MLKLTVTGPPAPLVLDFDIENRPLNYAGSDFTFSEITAIACSFGPGSEMYCWLLGRENPEDMLMGFHCLWDTADIVTGHYVLMHDIPIINRAMIEYQLPPLAPKYVSDTKVHLVKGKGLPVSQEALADHVGVVHPKIHMSPTDWREANRLTPAGLAKTEHRVTGDVRQHMAMRLRLLELGYLKPPRLWKP